MITNVRVISIDMDQFKNYISERIIIKNNRLFSFEHNENIAIRDDFKNYNFFIAVSNCAYNIDISRKYNNCPLLYKSLHMFGQNGYICFTSTREFHKFKLKSSYDFPPLTVIDFA